MKIACCGYFGFIGFVVKHLNFKRENTPRNVAKLPLLLSLHKILLQVPSVFGKDWSKIIINNRLLVLSQTLSCRSCLVFVAPSKPQIWPEEI